MEDDDPSKEHLFELMVCIHKHLANTDVKSKRFAHAIVLLADDFGACIHTNRSGSGGGVLSTAVEDELLLVSKRIFGGVGIESLKHPDLTEWFVALEKGLRCISTRDGTTSGLFETFVRKSFYKEVLFWKNQSQLKQ